MSNHFTNHAVTDKAPVGKAAVFGRRTVPATATFGSEAAQQLMRSLSGSVTMWTNYSGLPVLISISPVGAAFGQ